MLFPEREMAGPAWGFVDNREMPSRPCPEAGQPPDTWSLFKHCGIFLL